MSLSGPAVQIWKTLVQSNSFNKVLDKIKLVSVGGGECKAEMKVSEEHTNGVGTLHGGMTSTIVDVVSGLALSTSKGNPSIGVSVDLHVSFLKGANVGEEIVIEAKTKKAGRTLAFLDVEIYEKSSGKLVARGSHTKFIAM